MPAKKPPSNGCQNVRSAYPALTSMVAVGVSAIWKLPRRLSCFTWFGCTCVLVGGTPRAAVRRLTSVSGMVNGPISSVCVAGTKYRRRSVPPEICIQSVLRGVLVDYGLVSGFFQGLLKVRLSPTQRTKDLLASVHCTGLPTGTPPLRLCPQLRKLLANLLGWDSRPVSPKIDHFVFLLASPRFVLTTITPFAAAVPYSAAADGPLMMSIDSISSAWRSPTRLELVAKLPVTVPLSTRTPSTIMSGSLVSDSDARPRTRIGWLAPAIPAPRKTWTPAVRALSNS